MATHFIAQYLTNRGFPTTHECFWWNGSMTVRTSNMITDAVFPLAECSYTVGEWCHHEDVKHIPLIVILRDPFRVLNSLIAHKVEIGDAISVNRLMHEICYRWERLFDTQRVAFSFRVEFELDSLINFLKLEPNPENKIIRHTHSRSHIFIPYDRLHSFSGFSKFEAARLQYGYTNPPVIYD